jgi:hypothetical protein
LNDLPPSTESDAHAEDDDDQPSRELAPLFVLICATALVIAALTYLALREDESEPRLDRLQETSSTVVETDS